MAAQRDGLLSDREPASGGGAALPWGEVAFTWGLPGSEGIALDRPFDHFVVEMGSTASDAPAIRAHARGLVAGADFGDAGAGGLYGVFLSFDADTTPGHRVSTSAIGLRSTARSTDAAGTLPT